MISNILIDSPITGKRESLTQAQFNSYMSQTNGAVLKWIVNPVAKHGTHDQKTHGNWADGIVSGEDLINGDFNNPMLLSEGAAYSPFNPPEKRTDEALRAIVKKQGFDGPAQLVTQEEFDEILKSGGYERYRGVVPYTDGDGNLVDGDEIITEFAEGEYRAGLGVSGNGIYTTSQVDTASAYANIDGGTGEVVRIAILPSAKIATYEQVELAKNQMRDPANSPLLELGRIMAAQGYDGYVSTGNGVPSTIILNRTAVAVLKP
jgi:hypothetical protein